MRRTARSRCPLLAPAWRPRPPRPPPLAASSVSTAGPPPPLRRADRKSVVQATTADLGGRRVIQKQKTCHWPPAPPPSWVRRGRRGQIGCAISPTPPERPAREPLR